MATVRQVVRRRVIFPLLGVFIGIGVVAGVVISVTHDRADRRR